MADKPEDLTYNVKRGKWEYQVSFSHIQIKEMTYSPAGLALRGDFDNPKDEKARVVTGTAVIDIPFNIERILWPRYQERFGDKENDSQEIHLYRIFRGEFQQIADTRWRIHKGYKLPMGWRSKDTSLDYFIEATKNILDCDKTMNPQDIKLFFEEGHRHYMQFV